MKTLRNSIYCVILFGLVSGDLLSQEPAVIKIDFDRKIGVIDSNIYGAFVEPIRTVVHGTIYDPASSLADENGFRKDFIQLIRELKIPVLRWPGGNFVSGYNWEDGIGPKTQRPVRLDLAWNQVDKNQMGTDEYTKFYSLIGAKNFVCINGGTGTLDQARHWVEYCNYGSGTYYSDLRRKYGNEKPYNIRYWALGNEIDGPWQLGQKNAEDYCKFALEAAKMMQLVDKNIKLIASGASYYTADNDWIDWNDYVLQHLVGKIDYLSVHRYATEVLAGDRSFPSVMSLGIDVDKKIDMVKALIEKAMLKTGSKRPVYISFDEYSGYGDNLTGSSSLVGSSPEGDFKNALFQSFYLYSNNCHGTSLDVYTGCEKYNNKIFNDIPYLDVTAVLNESTKILVVNVVNRHETNPIPADIVLQTGNFTGIAKANELNGKSLTTRTTSTEEAVSVSTREVKFKGNTISYSFPAHSFTQLEIPVK